jgi:hypothetical protein
LAAYAFVTESTSLGCSKQLEAVQQIRRMRGGAQSQLMRASDAGFYVVKFRDNPQHVRVLANEFLASRLGQCLGLPMPDVQSIEICDWLIQHTPELRIETAGQSRLVSSGLHLASRFATDLESGQIFDYLPESMFPRVINRSDFPRTLVLDKWTCNSDGRQAVFAQNPPRRGYVATFIDQGYCFNAGEWSFPDQALCGIYYRNFVYATVASWDSFEPALTSAEEMDISDIWDCAAGIPQEWCGPDPGALPRLVEELHRRRSKIRELITAFRLSSRNPFSNWVRH